jgi:succinoglycan biosynthesis transport protein ExoP
MADAQRNIIVPDRRRNGVSTAFGGGLAPIGPAETETVSGLFRVLRRRLGTVIAVALAIIILGTAACFLITPKYSATTTIEINQDSQGVNSAAQDESASPTSDELKSEIQTDVQILQSDDLALEVVHDLNLEDKKPFHSAIYSKEKGLSLDRAPRTRERLLRVFANNLKVESPEDTRLIHVTFQNPDPTVSAAVAEDIANKFIDGTLERRQQSTVQSSYWLQKELDDLKTQVEQSEQKLADYERETGLAGTQFAEPTSGDGSGTVSASPHNTVTDRLFALNQELTSAEASRISAETVYRLVSTQDPEVVLGLGAMSVSGSSGGAGAAITTDGGIQLVRQLRGQEADLTREYSADAVKYGSNNPRLIQLQKEIDDVKGQTQAELGRISKRAENAYLYAKSNEDSIHSRFEQQQTAANAVADKTVQLQVLAQEAYSNRALYENLFSKLQTATLASGVRATRIDIVDHARPAGTQSSPDYGKYLALVFGLGAFFGISSAFLREGFDDTVRTPHDLDEMPSLRMLGYLPRLQLMPNPKRSSSESELIKSPLSPFSEAIRALRTSILHELPASKGRTLLVTSAVGGDGKTTVVYNLAIALAQQGGKVLLVDADIRNPDLHRMFGTALSPGLGDIDSWDDNSNLPRLVEHSSLSNLFLLPAGRQPELPAEFLASPLFGSVLETCARQFDYVLVDGAPILAVTDASIIAAKTSGIIAVLRSQSTTRPLAVSLIKALQRTESPVIGAVLNDVRHPMLDGYYEYSYSRQKGNHLHAG